MIVYIREQHYNIVSIYCYLAIRVYILLCIIDNSNTKLYYNVVIPTSNVINSSQL